MTTVQNILLPSSSVRETLSANTVESMRAIVKDSFERLNALGEYKDPKIALRGGVWMASAYIKLYRETELTEEERAELPSEKELEKVIWGYAPAQYFDRVQDQRGKMQPLRFISKTGLSASKALDAAIKGPLLVDCGAACQIAIHRALRDTLGAELYDKSFNGNLMIGPMAHIDPLFTDFLKQTETVVKEGKKVFQMRSGMWTGISNHPDYIRKHRFGGAGQINLIYAGKGKYLGLEHTPEGETVKELVEYLVEEFNLPPSKDLGGLVSKSEYEAGMKLLQVLQIKALMERKPLGDVKDKITAKDLTGAMEPDMTQEYNFAKIEEMIHKWRKEESKAATYC